MTQKAPIVLVSPTSLSTGTPNFLTNMCGHSFLLSKNTNNTISTVDVACAILMRGTGSINEEQILLLAKAVKSANESFVDQVCN